ncbi:substrate-binding periplasmic protein [Roseomonas chloroacetimidivorans]|uniref:substrate-binding periplasmic protein n=1 Tax=Roseomonas chloroacetimidivorans TaxID=1766656 RepID=UPI003C784026
MSRPFRRALAWIVIAGFAAVSSAVAQTPSTLERVKSAGVLRACFAQISPEAYKDARTGEWHGVFVELTKELADWMRVKMEIVEVQWPTIVPSLRRGDCDMVGGSLVYNAPRAMEVAYVRPMWAKGVNAIVRRADAERFKRPVDLNSPDVTLAVVAGSSENEVARRQFPRARILALQVQSNIQIMESVRRGDATAALLPTLTLRWWLAVPENGSWGALAFPNTEFASAPNAWAVRYGDPDWARFLDGFVSWAEASGLSARLYDEYLERANPYRK